MSFFDQFRRKKDKERLETLGRRDGEKKPIKESNEEKKKAAVKTVAPTQPLTARQANVLLHPIQSEKATKLLENNQYVFAVSPDATKGQVARAIRAMYDVLPLSVNIMNRKGKFVRYGRTTGVTSAKRKAVIVLKKGDSITLTQS